MLNVASLSSFFFFNDTATTEIYTLSLHDALPISVISKFAVCIEEFTVMTRINFRLIATVLLSLLLGSSVSDRKSTRLNSSHSQISYAVFCLKKKTYALYT